MHDTSMEAMAAIVDQYVDDLPRPRRVLDVGSLDINGSYRPLFMHDEYIGCDLTPGKNVDVVVKDQYNLPFPDGRFSLVVSGQTLEHCPQPWRLLAEMRRVVEPGGYVVTVNPSAGPPHMYPDCYRFFVEGMAGLAVWAGLKLTMGGIMRREPWHDCVAIMQNPRIVLVPGQAQ